MPSPLLSFLNALVHSPESLGIVGTGSQAQAMRAMIDECLRLKLDASPGASSAEIPLGRRAYLLCATPSTAARETLLSRGVPAELIVPWSELEPLVVQQSREVLREELGLRQLDKEDRSLPLDLGPPALLQLLRASETLLRELFDRANQWTADQAPMLETIANAYLLLRRQQAAFDGPPLRRLLFPSPGRCGGVSLTLALRRHYALRLHVDHEGHQDLIYQLLALHRQSGLSETVLIAFLALMLEDFDCLGGNPFCFLVPYLEHVPWFDCHLLKVERPLPELRESIIDRNFHYTAADFVPARITGAMWGDMHQAEWDNLPLAAKVDWYIQKVDEQISRGATACRSFVPTSLRDLHPGLNQILAGMRWPTIPCVPHVNTIPKDRVYSLEERIALFREEHARL